MTNESRPPVPPFTLETARQKVRMAQDAWNTREPGRVALAYTPDSRWRNRDVFLQGREAIVAFLANKWEKELEYRLIKQLWSFGDDRIAVRFFYEWHDAAGAWHRSHGNELWEFDACGLMKRREASINDTLIEESERVLRDDSLFETWDESWWSEPKPRAYLAAIGNIFYCIERVRNKRGIIMKTGHIGINVSDIERSKAFYTQVFGLESMGGSLEAGKEFEFLGENGTLYVTLWQQSAGRFDSTTPGLHHLSFEVESIEQVEAAETRVRELGAEFLYDGVVPHAEGGQSGGIFFRDPDGVRLEIYAPTGAQDAEAPNEHGPSCGFF